MVLRGSGDLVSILFNLISQIITPVIPISSLPTKSPSLLPVKRGLAAHEGRMDRQPVRHQAPALPSPLKPMVLVESGLLLRNLV